MREPFRTNSVMLNGFCPRAGNAMAARPGLALADASSRRTRSHTFRTDGYREGVKARRRSRWSCWLVRRLCELKLDDYTGASVLLVLVAFLHFVFTVAGTCFLYGVLEWRTTSISSCGHGTRFRKQQALLLPACSTQLTGNAWDPFLVSSSRSSDLLSGGMPACVSCCDLTAPMH